MKNTHKKIWILLSVAALMVSSGAASFAAQKRTFYKGLEPLKGSFAKASVLDAPATNKTETAEQPAQPVAPAVLQTPPETLAAQPPPRPESIPLSQPVSATEPVPSPCGEGQIPTIKNSQITGCSNIAEQTHYQLPTINYKLAPAPKAKIIERQPAPSCESAGRFTYTGEDRPGLLYGMCID